MKQRIVLDAWAILAFLQKEEPAAWRVRQWLERAAQGSVQVFASIINLGEVYYRVGKVKGEEQARETFKDLQSLPLTVVPATDEAVLAAARFKIDHAVSYADAFAAATAQELNAVLVTGDPELLQLAGQLQLEKLSRGG